MSKLCVADMVNGKASKFPLVVAVAQRARQITEELSLHGEEMSEKPVMIAFQEFKNHKFDIVESE